METRPSHPEAVGHETQDANIRPIVITLACLAAGAGLVFLMVFGILRYLADHPLNTAPLNPMADANRPEIPPGPRIQEHPTIELRDLHSQEDKILSTYGWTDRQAGIVRIPIDRAMDLQMQRGFPTRKEGKQ